MASYSQRKAFLGDAVDWVEGAMFPFTSAVLQDKKNEKDVSCKIKQNIFFFFFFMKESLTLLLFLDRLCKELNKNLCLLRGYL